MQKPGYSHTYSDFFSPDARPQPNADEIATRAVRHTARVRRWVSGTGESSDASMRHRQDLDQQPRERQRLTCYCDNGRVAGRKVLSRNELLTTDTELSAMAAAAHMGSSLPPQIG
jgi:hypothetical protein